MRRKLIPALMLILLAIPAIAADHGAWRNGRPIRVMTQNLYVGADVFRIQEAATPEQVPFVAAEIYETFLATDIGSRAERIAPCARARDTRNLRIFPSGASRSSR